jgi:hypothetical protein
MTWAATKCSSPERHPVRPPHFDAICRRLGNLLVRSRSVRYYLIVFDVGLLL